MPDNNPLGPANWLRDLVTDKPGTPGLGVPPVVPAPAAGLPGAAPLGKPVVPPLATKPLIPPVVKPVVAPLLDEKKPGADVPAATTPAAPAPVATTPAPTPTPPPASK
jgi:hypothetical protein